MKRIAIFIDGSNFYHTLKTLFPEKKPINFNFELFVNHLSTNQELVGAFYYNSPLDREKDETGYRKQQRFFDKIKRIQKFNLILCRMQKRVVNGKVVYEVKEDDIHLAVDMVRLAYDDAYDVAILVSTDGDFVPAIDTVRKKGKIVENIGFENKFSWHLRQKSDKFKQLKKYDLLNFFET